MQYEDKEGNALPHRVPTASIQSQRDTRHAQQRAAAFAFEIQILKLQIAVRRCC
jgi:hypothetical protein